MLATGSSRHLLVFARAPIEGQVKTRLHGALSKSDIVILHQNLVRRTVSMASQLPDTAVQLWVDCEPEHVFFRKLSQHFPGLTVHLQQGSDLGERMRFALKQASTKAQYTVLIGSDCPELSAEYVRQAFHALENSDCANENKVVLGPATDGGYVLLGSCLGELPIFDNIEWGSNTVYESTVVQLRKAKIPHLSLTPLSDIDRPEDLHIAQHYDLLGGSD